MNTRITVFCTGLLIVISFIRPQYLFCQKGKAVQIDSWITNPDRSALFEKQSDSLFFRNSNQGGGTTIVIDEASAVSGY